jgi:hypothetical protein
MRRRPEIARARALELTNGSVVALACLLAGLLLLGLLLPR